MDQQRRQMQHPRTARSELERVALPSRAPAPGLNAGRTDLSPQAPHNDVPETPRHGHRADGAREIVVPALRPAARHQLRTVLASRAGVRQAMLLSEILGPPRALRTREDV